MEGRPVTTAQRLREAWCETRSISLARCHSSLTHGCKDTGRCCNQVSGNAATGAAAELSGSGLGTAPPLGASWKSPGRESLSCKLGAPAEGLGRRGQGFLPVESGRVGPGGAGVRNPLPAGRSFEASRASAPLGSAVTWPPELRGGLTRWGRPRDCPAAPLAGAGQGLTAGESPRWCQRLARASRGGKCSQTERGARRGVRGCPLCSAPHPLVTAVCPRTFYLKHLRDRSVKNLTWESLVIQIFGRYSAAGAG